MATVDDLFDVFNTANGIIRNFGCSENFVHEYCNYVHEIRESLRKAFRLPRSAKMEDCMDLPLDTKLDPRTELLARKLHLWITENYRFPPREYQKFPPKV